MKKIFLLFALTATGALCSCSVGEKYKRPEIETPASFKNQQSSGNWPALDWWKNFGSANLTALEEQAKNVNYDIKAAAARVRQADARARIAGSSLYPSIGIDASGARERRGSGFTDNISGTSASYSSSIGAALSASYELDFWGKNRAQAESADANALASRYDSETIALTVSSDVANIYFAVLGLKDRLKVAEENLANSERLLKVINDRFTQGIVSRLDVERQQSVAEGQRANIPPLRLELEQNINSLAVLLAKLPEGSNIPGNSLAELSAPKVEAGIPSGLLERRPDIKNAEAALIAANADITVARAAFFPSISLTGSGGYQSSDFSNLFRSQGLLLSAGANLAQPIFRGGLLSGQLEFNKARYEELVANYRKTILSAFSDVENSLSAVKQTAEEQEAQSRATDTARRAYELANRQLAGGIIDITVVLDTQRTLFAAEDSLVSAKLRHLQAIVGLYRALGGGWQAEA